MSHLLRAWANTPGRLRMNRTRKRERFSRLCLEPLEDRQLLSTFLVRLATENPTTPSQATMKKGT